MNGECLILQLHCISW